MLNGLQVHLGFARACNPEEQEGLGGFTAHESVMGLDQCTESHHLLVIQRQRCGGNNELPRIRIPLINLGRDAHQTLVFELAHGLGGRLPEPKQLLKRQLPPLLDDAPNRLLPRREFGQFADHRERVHMKPFAPPGILLADSLRQNTLERRLDRAAIVGRNPTSQLQHLRRDQSLGTQDIQDGLEVGLGRGIRHRGHQTQHLSVSEGHLDPGPHGHPPGKLLRNGIVELLAEGYFESNAGDHK